MTETLTMDVSNTSALEFLTQVVAALEHSKIENAAMAIIFIDLFGDTKAVTVSTVEGVAEARTVN